MADINLLPSEEKLSDRLSSLQKKLTMFSVVVLAVVAVLTVATLVLFAAEKNRENDLKGRVSEAASLVNSHQLSEELLTVVDKKAESATKAISSRFLYTEVLKKTAELMPLGVAFADLKIDGVKMSASATADTSADVANLVSSFVTTDEGKKLFSSMSIDSLATDAQGKYTFAVSMQINQSAAQAAKAGN